MKTSYSVIGVMAGSSMDGLDIALVDFSLREDSWLYKIQKAQTVPYEKELFQQLKASPDDEKEIQLQLDDVFGKWIAEQINLFKKDNAGVDLAGVHGHTVLHRPQDGISWQLGSGEVISKISQIPVVTDFRTLDIQLGGQGAPLVPFGDFQLYRGFDACLNLGGIANISLQSSQTAWDICPCNQVLNYFAIKLGKPYDEGGNLARTGNLHKSFYESLSDLPYFSLKPPKSLPNNFIPSAILDDTNPTDGLRTYIQFIADQISKSLINKHGRMLVTGGGAHNDFLIEVIRSKLNNWEVVVPDSQLVDFKESLIFAFLALKCFRNEINVLASVTGASKDSSSGVIHLP
uniref:anhydro-N-acetylmuramic acid kinase n=1 Tax=Ekhidna sp. TaxID=2608089 RepID=UPI0032EAEC27